MPEWHRAWKRVFLLALREGVIYCHGRAVSIAGERRRPLLLERGFLVPYWPGEGCSFKGGLSGKGGRAGPLLPRDRVLVGGGRNLFLLKRGGIAGLTRSKEGLFGKTKEKENFFSPKKEKRALSE